MAATPDAPTPTAPTELDATLTAATVARGPLLALGVAGRQRALAALAEALRAAVDDLVPLAQAETHLPEPRLRGELARTAFQLDLYGAAAADAFVVEHDAADANAIPAPRPDLWRTQRPIGVVLNFTASNFPFGFSVVGTDTAAALAAGCPVIVKAHSGHPRLSRAVFDVARPVLEAHGCPPGTLALIVGTDAGVQALKDDRVDAAAFTGSLSGGRALFDIANSRPRPIPFYGELGSLNPAIVAPHAAAHRGDAVAAGFFGSFTLGAGQFCTKPGLLFWPAATPVPESLLASVRGATTHELLNARITAGFAETTAAVEQLQGVRVLAQATGGASRALLMETDAAALIDDPASVLVECFGPAALIVRYQDIAQLTRALARIDGSLTGTIHADEQEDAAVVTAILPLLEDRVGRIVWGDWPTGVAVAMAQQHGGPYPAATNGRYTSVGTHAIDRFLRPVTYQDVPERFRPATAR